MSDQKKTDEAAWREAAVQHGMRFARHVFEKRGNNSEAHLTEAELAAMMAVSFEHGALEGAWELEPNETTIAAMLEAREGKLEKLTFEEFEAELRQLRAEAEAEAAAERLGLSGPTDSIKLTRAESMQLLEMMENPPPQAERFKAAMERYRRVVLTRGMTEAEREALRKSEAPEEAAQFDSEVEERWIEENKEAIQSSNEYVEKHGLPLAKYTLKQLLSESDYSQPRSEEEKDWDQAPAVGKEIPHDK